MSRRLTVLAVAGATTALSYAAARLLPEARRAPWARTNHAGHTVTLLEGPTHALGLAFGGVVGGTAPVVASMTSAAFGALDDLAGDGSSKGLKGHLSAATRGEVTTGLVKIGGLALTGITATALADRRTGRATVTGTLVGGAVVAGTANLLNLFDLRPGRALKVGVILGAPLALAGGDGGVPAAAAVGASLASLPADLRGEAMLGDTGANALGALLGTALVSGRSTRTRLLALAVLTGLTLASERVSFTQVIEATPVLREIDAWGRPPR